MIRKLNTIPHYGSKVLYDNTGKAMATCYEKEFADDIIKAVDYYIKHHEPLEEKPRLDDDGNEIPHWKMHMYDRLCGKERQYTNEELLEEIQVVWENIVLERDSKLTGDARELKQKLLKICKPRRAVGHDVSDLYEEPDDECTVGELLLEQSKGCSWVTIDHSLPSWESMQWLVTNKCNDKGEVLLCSDSPDKEQAWFPTDYPCTRVTKEVE